MNDNTKRVSIIMFFVSRVPKLFTSCGGSPHDCVTAFRAHLTRYITRSQWRQQLISLFATQFTEERQLQTPRTSRCRCCKGWTSNFRLITRVSRTNKRGSRIKPGRQGTTPGRPRETRKTTPGRPTNDAQNVPRPQFGVGSGGEPHISRAA